MAFDARAVLAAERRRFRRLQAPVFVRPAGRRWVGRKVEDIGLGGLRVFSDDAHPVGSRLEMDLLLAGGELTVLAEVVWIETLPDGAASRYDVGLRFVDPPAEALARIAAALGE